MKWYSVKHYRPPANGYCLVRTENGAFYTAEWRNGDSDDPTNEDQYSSGWMMDTMCEEYSAPESIDIYGVTHFCIPEPVEKE